MQQILVMQQVVAIVVHVANATRGFWAGGFIAPAVSNNIDFVTIASTGDFQDFGDLLGNGCGPLVECFTNSCKICW